MIWRNLMCMLSKALVHKSPDWTAIDLHCSLNSSAPDKLPPPVRSSLPPSRTPAAHAHRPFGGRSPDPWQFPAAACLAPTAPPPPACAASIELFDLLTHGKCNVDAWFSSRIMLPTVDQSTERRVSNEIIHELCIQPQDVFTAPA